MAEEEEKEEMYDRKRRGRSSGGFCWDFGGCTLGFAVNEPLPRKTYLDRKYLSRYYALVHQDATIWYSATLP